MELDLLVFAAHPDDAELACAGTIIKHIKAGYKVGIVDLTRGELGTRGSAELREEESKNASEVLGVHARENLDMKDGFFRNDEEHQRRVIKALRKYRPRIVICNAVNDRHIDHGRSAQLEADACFLSGLVKIETFDDRGNRQEAWRPKLVLHYIQDRFINPDIVVDITEEWEQKMKAIQCYKSQFYDPASKEPVTPIATRDYIEFLPSRARELGRIIGVTFGEGFTVRKAIGVNDLTTLA
jgi:bacillithiol biosynthesis deacetylase BshB1